MMKKVVIAIASGVTTLMGMRYVEAFAADACQTCSATSPIIDQYMDFSYEIIQTLQTIANDKQRNVTQNTNTDILTRIADNLNQKGQTAVTFNVLMGTIGGQILSTSVRQEIEVMTNAESLMRDREKLDTLDQDISDTLFDLGQAGMFIANTQDYQQRMKAVIDSYISRPDSFLQSSGQPSTSAEEMIAALWDMNQAYKRFIASGKTDGFIAFSRKHSEKVGFTLSEVNYIKLVEQYSCTRGINKCDETYKKFGQNMGDIVQDAQGETKEAIKTITNAVERLKCAFAKQGNLKCQQSGFRDKQNDLLRGLYGIEGPYANRQGVSALANSMDRLGNSLVREINDVKEFYTKNDNPKSTIILPQAPMLDVGNPDLAARRGSENLYTDLMTSLNGTMQASKKSWQQHALADPLVVTRNMPSTSIMVYNSVNIIGDPQKAKSIVQSLGKACENQCTNVGGTCYY